MQSALDNWNINSTISTSKRTFSSVVSYMNSGKPIIACGYGHTQVVRGYYEDTSNGTQDIYYIDPYFRDGYFIEPYSEFSSWWNSGCLYNIYV